MTPRLSDFNELRDAIIRVEKLSSLDAFMSARSVENEKAHIDERDSRIKIRVDLDHARKNLDAWLDHCEGKSA